MDSKLTIHRVAHWVNNKESFDILVDNQKEKILRDGGKISITLSPGKHFISIQMGYHHLRSKEIDLKKDEELKIQCGFSSWRFWFVGGFLRPEFSFFIKQLS